MKHYTKQDIEQIKISPERLALLHRLNERGKKKYRERHKKKSKVYEDVEVCYNGKYMMFPRYIAERK